MDNISECVLCVDPETSENPIVVCGCCGVKVHTLCYGIEIDSDDENWKCSPCNTGSDSPVCKLCVQNGGAFKKTTCGGWVHVLCGLFTEGCNFLDNNIMEPVDISLVSDSKRNKTCVFCKSDCGFSSLCSRGRCNDRLHISCAHKNRCLKEDLDKHGKIKFRAYCNKHKPSDSCRRISSEFVRGAVMKKKEAKFEKSKQKSEKSKEKKEKAERSAREKNEKETSSDLNIGWLIEKSMNANKSASSAKKRKFEQQLTVNGEISLDPSKSKRMEISDCSNSLKWDSYNLQIPNINREDSLKIPSFDSIFGDENKENTMQVCYKDEKINKVSTIYFFLEKFSQSQIGLFITHKVRKKS